MFTLAASAQPAKLVLDMLVILGAAAIISILLRRLHLASIPGYLIIGATLGSLPFGIISDPSNVSQIQDIAIILLMFTIGLHLDLDSIRTGMVPILIVGAVSTIVGALVLWPAGMAFGLSAPAALAVAMAFSMSSTAVVLGILHQHREVHLVQGRLGIGIAIMQDLLAIGILASMPVLAAWHGAKIGEGDEPSGIAQIVANASLGIGGILAMLGFARYLLPKLLREAAWGGNTEGLLVASAGAGLGAAMLTGWLGFGPALGAFLAGFMLSNTPFRFQLTGQLGPMRDLFMAVFFTAVGINLNVIEALQYWWVILIAVPLVMIVKAGVTGMTIWAGGSTAAAALVAGTLLAQAGEFSLVVLSEAKRKGLVGDREEGVAIALVVVSLMVTGSLYEYAKKNTARVAFIKPAMWFASPALRGSPMPAAAAAGVSGPGDHGQPASPDGQSAHDVAGSAAGSGGAVASSEAPAVPKQRHVIIAGYGIVGRNLAEHFAASSISYTLIDLNSDTVMKQKKLGKNAVYGDATNKDVLESAGIHHAEAVVLTIPDDDATLRACRAIREMRDDVFIAVRTTFLSRAIAAHELGADHVTIEEVATAQDMAVKVMLELNKRFTSKGDSVPHL